MNVNTRTGEHADIEETKGECEDLGSLPFLQKQKNEIESKQKSILGTFELCFGPEDSKGLFERVVQNPEQFSQDERPLFRELSKLAHTHRQICEKMQLATKTIEYQNFQPGQVIEKLVRVEQQLEKLKKKISSPTHSNFSLYFFGGNKTSGVIPTTQMYDVRNRCWVELPDMPTARSSALTVVHQNRKIYVIGGIYQANISSSAVEAFDLITKRWTCLPNLPESLGGLQASIFQDNILVWGRKEQITFIFKLDLSSSTWNPIPSPPLCDNNETESILLMACSSTLVSIRGKVGAHITCFIYDLSDASASWQCDQSSGLACSLDMAQVSPPPCGFKTSFQKAIFLVRRDLSLTLDIQRLSSGAEFGPSKKYPWKTRLVVHNHPKVKSFFESSNLFTLESYPKTVFLRADEQNQPNVDFHLDPCCRLKIREPTMQQVFVFDMAFGSWKIYPFLDNTNDCKILDFRDEVILMSHSQGVKLYFTANQQCIPLPLSNEHGIADSVVLIQNGTGEEAYDDFEMPM